MYQRQIEYVIRELHDMDGVIVRISPNDLVFAHHGVVEQAMSPEVHSKRFTFNLLKFSLVHEIYDRFELFDENVFGTQDESLHTFVVDNYHIHPRSFNSTNGM